jgi:hypothetical protein
MNRKPKLLASEVENDSLADESTWLSHDDAVKALELIKQAFITNVAGPH